MKKLFIIFINILVFILLFLLLDFCTAYIDYSKSHNSQINQAVKHKDFTNFKFADFNYSLNLNHFKHIYDKQKNDDKYWNSLSRIAKTENKTKGSVIVFGCSFTEGAFLKGEQKFEYKLSQLTDRTVFNRGFSGFGLSPMVWMSKNDDFYEDIKNYNPPEYIIYVYIYDHIRRIYEERYGVNFLNSYVGFKEENNTLKEKYPWYLQLDRFTIMKNYVKNVVFKKALSKENQDKNFDLLKLYFEETRREFQKRYPDVKFIIIKYPADFKHPEIIYSAKYSYTTPRWKELEEEGFIVYDLKDRIKDIDFESDEYTFPDGHPNEKAWDVITGQLVKDLNLY